MPGGRVLMIAHHFPPAGGSGSNRALAFARHLPNYGWTPTVLTPATVGATNRDRRLPDERPPGLRVVRTRSWEVRPKQTISSGGTGSAPTNTLRSNLGHLK